MAFTAAHKNGLDGYIADLSARIASEEAEYARASRNLARKLRAAGREEIVKYLALPDDRRELTRADENELRKFLIAQEPGDIRVNDTISSWSEGFVRFDSILAFLIPNNLVVFARFAPAIFLVAVWIVGLWSPITTGIVTVCEFFIDSKLQQALGLKSSGLIEPWFYTAKTFGFESLPGFFWIVAILAAARIWQRPHFIRTIGLNIAIVAGVYFYAGAQISELRSIESKIPTYCNSHVNEKIQIPTPEQYKRFTPRQR